MFTELVKYVEENVTLSPTADTRTPIIIRKMANDYDHTKINNRVTTDSNINYVTNKHSTQGNYEEIQQSITKNEEQSQGTTTQFLAVS